MRATITRIDPPRHGNGTTYKLVLLKSSTGEDLKTYACPNDNNYARWKDLLEVGVILENLLIKDKRKGIISMDSYPRLVFRPAKQKELF